MGMPSANMEDPTQSMPVTISSEEMPSINGPGFGKMETDTLPQSVLDSGEWKQWTSLEGTLIWAPTATSWSENRLDVFVISTDSNLHHKYWNGSKWSTWENLEGTCIFTPASVSWGPNRLHVFVIGIDKQLYHKWWDGSKWNDWESLGGTCIHGVTATSWSPNRIDLFTVGTNSVIYHKSGDGKTWDDWQPVTLKNTSNWEKSSTTIATPAAIASKPGRIDLFALGIDNHVYHTQGDSHEWKGWKDVGGPCIQGIAATARGANYIDLFTIGTDIEGTDNHMYHRCMKDGQWSPWENLGGACISSPAAIASSENRLDVFVIGTRSELYQKSYLQKNRTDGTIEISSDTATPSTDDGEIPPEVWL